MSNRELKLPNDQREADVLTEIGLEHSKENIAPESEDIFAHDLNWMYPYIPSSREIQPDNDTLRLIEKCDNSSHAIMNQLYLARQKVASLTQLAAYLEAPSFMEGQISQPFQVQDELNLFDTLFDACLSKNPYQKIINSRQILDLLTDEDREVISSEERTMSKEPSFLNRLRKKDPLADKKQEINQQALHIIADTIERRIQQLNIHMREKTSALNRFGGSVRGYWEFVRADEGEMEKLIEPLRTSVKDLNQQISDVKKIEKLTAYLDERLQRMNFEQTKNAETVQLYTRFPLFVRETIDEYNKKLSDMRNEVLQNLKSGLHVRNYLSQLISDFRREIVSTIEDLKRPEKSDLPGTRAIKEVIDVVAGFNSSVTQALRFTDVAANQERLNIRRDSNTIPWIPNSDHAHIARELSQDSSFLSHATKTEQMYEILETGHLMSIEQRRSKTKEPTGLHRRWDETREEHQICFQRDGLYSSFSSKETAKDFKILANIALLFDENNLLASGRQFFDLDGIHIFDKDFSGDAESSPGLDLDLTRVPFIIAVAQKELPNLIRFLKEKSVWRDQFASALPDTFDEWMKNNILVIDNLDNLPEQKNNVQNLFNAKTTRAKRGYVINTEYQSDVKGGSRERTMRFIPFGEYESKK